MISPHDRYMISPHDQLRLQDEEHMLTHAQSTETPLWGTTQTIPKTARWKASHTSCVALHMFKPHAALCCAGGSFTVDGHARSSVSVAEVWRPADAR